MMELMRDRKQFKLQEAEEIRGNTSLEMFLIVLKIPVAFVSGASSMNMVKFPRGFICFMVKGNRPLD